MTSETLRRLLIAGAAVAALSVAACERKMAEAEPDSDADGQSGAATAREGPTD